uniref:Uncharacterized protein n=1 Tax=Tetradesmus obliquus TaxID=3088 RepID=A0A383VLK1_TETOB
MPAAYTPVCRVCWAPHEPASGLALALMLQQQQWQQQQRQRQQQQQQQQQSSLRDGASLRLLLADGLSERCRLPLLLPPLLPPLLLKHQHECQARGCLVLLLGAGYVSCVVACCDGCHQQ